MGYAYVEAKRQARRMSFGATMKSWFGRRDEWVTFIIDDLMNMWERALAM